MIRVDIPAFPGSAEEASKRQRTFRLRVTGLSGYRAYAYMAFIKGPGHYAVGRTDTSPKDPQFEFSRLGDALSFADASAGATPLRTLNGSSFAIDLQAWQPLIEQDVTRSLRVVIEEITPGADKPDLGEWRFVEGEAKDVDDDVAEYVKGGEWIVDVPMRIRFK